MSVVDTFSSQNQIGNGTSCMVLIAQSNKIDYKFYFIKEEKEFFPLGFLFAGRGLRLSEPRLLREPGEQWNPEARVLLHAG